MQHHVEGATVERGEKEQRCRRRRRDGAAFSSLRDFNAPDKHHTILKKTMYFKAQKACPMLTAFGFLCAKATLWYMLRPLRRALEYDDTGSF